MSDQLKYRDVQPAVLYDTVHYWANSMVTPDNSVFFVNVGVNSGKTLAQTNLVKSKALPDFSAGFLVKSLEVYVSAYPLDCVTLADGLVLTLWVGEKMFWRGPLPVVASFVQKLDEEDPGPPYRNESWGDLDLMLLPGLPFYASFYLTRPVYTMNQVTQMRLCLRGLDSRKVV